MVEELAPQPEPKPKAAKGKKPEVSAPAAKPARTRAKSAAVSEFEDELAIVTFRAITARTKPSRQASEPREGGSSSRRSRRRRSDRPETGAAPEPKAVVIEEIDLTGEDLPMPIWRALQGGPRNPEPDDEVSSFADAEPKRPQRERGRRREPAKPIAAAAPAEPKPEPIPVKVSKPLIPTPDDAPQVVLRAGVPTLVRNHRVYPPIVFFGNPADERRANTVLEEVRMAAGAGVHLYAHLIDLEVDYNSVDDASSFAAYLLKKTVEIDPEAQVLFRVVFQSPRGWEDRFPKARYRTASGAMAEPSLSDDDYWDVARKCLESFVRQLRMVDLRDHLLGIHLDRGEWFMAEDAGYDDSRAALGKFRDWARTRYSNDVVTLRASWFDGSVSFDNIDIPRPGSSSDERFIRSSRRQRKFVDYNLFLSDETVQRIGELAYAAKEASEGYFLVGVSYGYTFEWSHPSSGHLSLGKLLRSPEIDFVAGPPSYRTREPGGAAPFPGPIDSFALNGKLYISEEDFKTSLAIGHEPDDFNPQLRTPQALESVHWRGAGAALAHSSGIAWMDLWGNGWLKTPSVWERASRLQTALIDRMEAPVSNPDVAVFIDERSLAYLVEPHAFQLLVQNVRESVLRAGVSAGFYLLSDLAHREVFPESKLYIFLNAWDIRPELRAAIKSRLQKEDKVLFWLYSAGLFDNGRDSLERAREVTGIALKPQPYHSRSGTTILNKRHPLSEAFPDRTVGGTQLEPSYFAIPEGATVLGEYTQTGLPSFVVREFRDGPAESHWTSVFLGEPQVNPALIRALAQMAGVHIWNFNDDVVHVRPPFLTIHCTGPGTRTVAMPGKYAAYNFINQEWAGESGNVRLIAADGSTHVLLVGPRTEVDHLLRFDPSTVLRIEELPERDTNVRIDASNFDVPIMRLDEWIEGGDSDDVADEWFLRAPPVQDEPQQATESPERIGRRRRSRGRDRDRDRDRGTRDAPRESFSVQSNDAELDISVMFRKRD